MKLALTILTPESQVYSGEADELIIPTAGGEITVLPNHVSLLTQILPGEMRVINGGKTNSFAIMGGYLEVNNNQVNVLGDYAVRAEDIEVAYTTAQRAIAWLERYKILKLTHDVRRGKVYVAQALLDILDEPALRTQSKELGETKRKRQKS